MTSGVIVDTSVFVDYLRGGSSDLLAVLVLQNQVLLSPIVRLELLAGVRRKELNVLETLLSALKPVDSFASCEECEKLLHKARGSGLLGGIPDLLIIADAIRFQAPLFSRDANMRKLAKRLGVSIVQD